MDSSPDPAATPATHPRVKLRANADLRPLRAGSPWVFADEIAMDRRTRKLAPGTIVTLLGPDREPLGTFAFNPASRIAARRLDSAPDVPIDADWLAARLDRAIALREQLFDAPFWRLAHGEGDDLPGLIIDRYGEAAVIQPNAAWAEGLSGTLADLLAARGMGTVVLNGTARARSLEGLPRELRLLRGALDGPVPVPMNGATYMADLLGGQKTGLYFDQRANHALAARMARGGRMLDVFSHVGGFSLAALVAGARSALAIDGSAAALALAEEGARRSGVAERFATRRADAFDAMAALASEGERFDLVVCDPPAFAPSRAALEAGLRAYERVARLAARLVAPGGFLVLCSCSHAASLEAFRTASLRGLRRAGRSAVILATGGAGPDHPLHPQLTETGYLKALFLRLDG